MSKLAAIGLLSSTALVSLGSGALAQTRSSNPLEEVVVTATRQADTVNRVPLSVTAVTQKSIEDQGIRNAQDLAFAVPALRITPPATNGIQISIRGIASAQGAATTGVYLDDTPLQRRAGQGAVNGIGTVIPQLFDLERVEVLRGPQGTLFGGSSEGGTIRFITPTPSLTKMSGMARGEVSKTQMGGTNYEAGVALGGPIVQDKLGFRASFWDRHNAGYIDHVSRFTGNVLAKDTNSKEQQAMRLALRWEPMERLTITPAFYYSKDDQKDADIYWENVPQFTQAARVVSPTFTYPAHTYGPYNMYGPGKTGTNMCVYADALVTPSNDQCAVLQPRKDTLAIPSLTVNYRFDGMTLTSATSYEEDHNKGKQAIYSSSIGTANGNNEFAFNLPYSYGLYTYQAKRREWVEEVRLASNMKDSRLQWVVGVFYSNSRVVQSSFDIENFDTYNLVLNGRAPSASVHFPGNPDLYALRAQTLDETELAAFGEANYLITDKLKFTVGVRTSQTKFNYTGASYGPGIGNTLEPTIANGGLVAGGTNEKPFTYKLGLSYQFDPTKMVYGTVATGYRAGGVNNTPPIGPGGRCTADVASLGLTTTPLTFDSDTVTSYEGGAKLGLFGGRAQVNSSLFYIKWKSPQTNFALPTCGFSYVINVGEAVSKGGDIQAQFRLLDNLTGNVSVAYTDSRYTQSVIGPAPRFSTFVTKGDRLPTAPWTVSVGAQYDFTAPGQHKAFVRGDYRYSSRYRSGGAFPVASYAPETQFTPSNALLNLRAGMNFQNWDLALFADNALNSQDVFGPNAGQTARRSGCTTAACTTYTSIFPVSRNITYRPRTIGVAATYRY